MLNIPETKILGKLQVVIFVAIEPKSAQQKVQIRAYSSASGRGRVNAPKTRAATPSELGNRERTEILWVCDRSENIRSELKDVLARYQNNRKEN